MAITQHIKNITKYITRSSSKKKIKKCNTKITICAFCVKDLEHGCSHSRSYAMKTTTAHWKKLKKKYRWKIGGNKKLSCYLKKECKGK